MVLKFSKGFIQAFCKRFEQNNTDWIVCGELEFTTNFKQKAVVPKTIYSGCSVRNIVAYQKIASFSSQQVSFLNLKQNAR